MNVFLISLANNLILGLIGLNFPPFYFLLRRKFGVALITLPLVVWGGQTLILFCAGLVVISVMAQIFIDYRFRYIIAENMPYTWYYPLFDWISRVLGGQRPPARDTYSEGRSDEHAINHPPADDEFIARHGIARPPRPATSDSVRQ